MKQKLADGGNHPLPRRRCFPVACSQLRGSSGPAAQRRGRSWGGLRRDRTGRSQDSAPGMGLRWRSLRRRLLPPGLFPGCQSLGHRGKSGPNSARNVCARAAIAAACGGCAAAMNAIAERRRSASSGLMAKAPWQHCVQPGRQARCWPARSVASARAASAIWMSLASCCSRRVAGLEIGGNSELEKSWRIT